MVCFVGLREGFMVVTLSNLDRPRVATKRVSHMPHGDDSSLCGRGLLPALLGAKALELRPNPLPMFCGGQPKSWPALQTFL